MNDRDFLIGFIGTGKMGSAILKGLISSGISGSNICFFDPDTQISKALEEETGCRRMNSEREVYSKSKFTFLCVKPDKVNQVMEAIKPADEDAVIVSIAAGVPVSQMRKFGDFKVIRTMPNTPALVRKGITAVAKSDFVSREDFDRVLEFFSVIGDTVVVEEKDMDAVTALSGSGPAYVFLFIEALKEAGILTGLSAGVAEKLAVETIAGAVELFRQSGKSTSELIEMVASPGGTTIKALKKLEKHGFKHAVMDAVEAAYKRSKELGRKEES